MPLVETIVRAHIGLRQLRQVQDREARRENQRKVDDIFIFIVYHPTWDWQFSKGIENFHRS